MRLNDEESAMRAGEAGEVARIAIEHQIKVGDFFGAEDFVAVTQAHIMADTESLGQAGVLWLERLADAKDARASIDGGVRIPTITDPRGTDFVHAAALGQADWMLELERRAIAAFVRLGVSMTDTCINYQTVLAATRGEHVAFGDTGVVIYSNSVNGARSNFEGGPSALSAGLTGRTPRYGYHLDAHRRATLRIHVDWTPKRLDEWGALGGVIGRLAGNYWEVPVIEGIDGAPGSDELKHFGAAMASFGSTALYHLVGHTPEAPTLADVDGASLPVAHRVGEAEVRALTASYAVGRSAEIPVDVVVFSAPQLSLFELRALAALCDGRRFVKPLLAVTSPQVKPDADRFGFSARIEAAGGTVLAGMCFYQSYAREMAEANGWKRLGTNSAKLVNILGGYGYLPMLASMEACVDAAETGKLAATPAGGAMSAITLTARHAMGRKVVGQALVASDGFSARYDLDRLAGVFSRPAHKLFGQSYVDRILVLDTAKGGVATAWMLHEMRSRRMAPLAIVFNTVNTILAQGAALGDITMMAGFDVDVTAVVPHGTTIELDPATRTLRVLEARAAAADRTTAARTIVHGPG